MKVSLLDKLTTLVEHYQELSQLLADESVIKDLNRFRDLSKEYVQLGPIVCCFLEYQANLNTIDRSEQMLQEGDLELRELALDEIKTVKLKQQELTRQLEILLLPSDPNDQRNIFLEIRSAAGGNEAAIFAGDLFRMYSRYTERKGWNMEVINAHFGEHGGYKEVVARIVGQAVYAYLKFESGAHRVQRVPSTEAQGRIHTSTCTVAVLPEVEAIDEIIINPSDLKVDSFRASGAGGQHVQKTDSAVRMTHLPTGLVVECQDERSQHKNRARALSLLQAKLLADQRSKQQNEQAEARRNLVGSGDRSERIRTYNFPQGRLTDHRIHLTLYQLSAIMEGRLEEVIEPLIREYQAEQLAAIGD